MEAAMSVVGETKASLRLFGDDLDLAEITRLLGGAPTSSVRKGEIWLPDGSTRERLSRTGVWMRVAAPREPGDLPGQIDELLGDLTIDLAAWRMLAQKFRADVFCGLFLHNTNEGLDLYPSTLQLLASRGLRMSLDIYGDDYPR
jgi:hypothetical protein